LAVLSVVIIVLTFFEDIPVLPAFAPIILLYILLSVVKWLLERKKSSKKAVKL
jgi:hypothetical protein